MNLARKIGLTGLFLALGLMLPAAASAEPPLTILGYDLADNRDVPELSFRASEMIARRSDAPLEQKVAVVPQTSIAVAAHDDRLCLTGFTFGQTYAITLKAGLNGVSGALAGDLQYRILVPSRPPELSFASSGADVLVREKATSLAVHSVNVAHFDAEILRIPDHDVLRDMSHRPLTGASLAKFAPAQGDRVWHGSFSPETAANRDVTTLIPIDSSIGAQPGLYVAVVWPSDQPVTNSDAALATQYFTISDFGLASYRSAAGLLIAVRSLTTAGASPGVDVVLIGENNRELGRAKSDENGLCRFDPALLKAVGGDRPAGILAYDPDGSFGYLKLGDEAAGGNSLAPAQAVIFANRSSFSPGDAVDLTILARDTAGAALAKAPIAVDLIRPDGSVLESRQAIDQGAGGYTINFNLPDSLSGLWQAVVRTAGNGAVLGKTELNVGLPAAPRLTVALSADAAILDPAQPATVTVQSFYPDGRIATGAPGELHVGVQAAANPFPAFPGFAFGLAEEGPTSIALDPMRFSTDPSGKAYLPLKLPQTRRTRPLEARLVASVLDLGGKPIEQAVTVPVGGAQMYLGVRAVGGPALPEKQPAQFEAIALSPDGARQEKKGLAWEIWRREPAPAWSWDGGRFAYRPETREVHVAAGTVDAPMDKPGPISANLPQGRYRIELFDPAGEAASSVAFEVGPNTGGADPGSNQMEITPAKPVFTPGETAEIFVKPPFDSNVLLVSADAQIRNTVIQHLPAAGGAVRLDVPADAGPVIGLAATAFATADPAAPELPRRAYQAATLPRDPSYRRLGLKLELPAAAPPQHDLPVKIATDAPVNGPTFVRVIAEGFASERPAAAKDGEAEAPGVGGAATIIPIAATDDYGRIITASGLSGSQLPASAPDPARQPGPDKTGPAPFSFVSAVAALDKDGKGTVLIPLSDFLGDVRLRVVAWSQDRLGTADSVVPVRFPLALDLPLPEAIRADDHAELALSLVNTEGPRGEYRVEARVDGPLALQSEPVATFNLAEHEERSLPIALQASGPGEAHITLTVHGPGDIAIERPMTLRVLAAASPIFRHASVSLKSGATATADPALTAGLKSESVEASMVASQGRQFDLRALARELAETPSNSIAGIIAAATPCLTAPAPGGRFGGKAGISSSSRSCLEAALVKLIADQRDDGGWAYPGAGRSDLWLSASVMDFLARAQVAGMKAPEDARGRALDFLKLRTTAFAAAVFASDGNQGAVMNGSTVNATAYADYVLAENSRLSSLELQALVDRIPPPELGPAARGFFGAAFVILGDVRTANDMFAAQAAPPPAGALDDGLASELRDQALLAALVVEAGAGGGANRAAALDRALTAAASRPELNPEEAVWMFRAAAGAEVKPETLKIKVGEETIKADEPYKLAVARGQPLPVIRNLGNVAINLNWTISGSPASDSKSANGIEIDRAIFDPAGKPVDAASLRQGDIAVVVLYGHLGESAVLRPLVTDYVPAGWTIETSEIANAAVRYPWLKDLTGATPIEGGHGRFAAVPNTVGERRDFKFAYVARATFVGQFDMPGATIEDLAAPAVNARSSASRTKVTPAS
jgi:uncharacterized protein YfaS (alpha-2-macroglobulin family)